MNSAEKQPASNPTPADAAGTSMNRRDFVVTAGAVVAAGLTGCASQTGETSMRGGVLATAASKKKVLGANERVRMGQIGVGGMGGGHLRSLVRNSTSYNCDVVAVCDLFSKRREYAAQHANCKGYIDYRELLERKDVDAVLIATPDHWHAPIAIDAMRAGKDVYLEKPMTYTAEEAVRVRDVCEETGAVMQVGTQYTSMDCYWRARQAVSDGRIGKPIWAQSSFSRNSRDGEWNYFVDPAGNEQTIDWTRFLGSRPKRAFDPQRFFRWRKYWDYSGGIATDLFFHRLSPLMLALGPSFPRRVVASGGIWHQKDGREVPDTYFTTIDYPGEYSVNLVSSMCNEQGVDVMIRGLHGTITVDENADKIKIKGENEWIEEFKKSNDGKTECEETRVAAKPNWYDGHMQNFLECVRTRNKPNCHAAMGAMIMVAIAASVKSFRENRVVFCDPQTGKLS
ncbi:MAG: Inositol 2-dehydrogenase/D-chiro-inositol 3-dehydrogenase [Phycisphaerae bacterium]|nr:Inositol 2-dehydrogenase/D-chiro-inositol 3-dehydrogenase [Phycisphaerae bacterium]